MTPQENYHDWLRDAHAMEKQAESMLSAMSKRIDNYPDLRARIEQHLTGTQGQITLPGEHLPDVTEQFIFRDAADGVEAKKIR